MTKYLRYIYYPIGVVLLLLAMVEFWPIAKGIITHISKYQWMIYGMIAYFVVRRFSFFSRNELWLQTISHESTHAIVGMMFLRKIHSLQAGQDSGMVQHSGRNIGGIFISLAPYCLPIVTYLILFFRIIGADSMLYVFDLFIGFSLAFHVVCFWKQTRPDQPDIKQYGVIGSYLFIAIALLFNASIILMSIRKGIVDSAIYLFSSYWDTIIKWIEVVF